MTWLVLARVVELLLLFVGLPAAMRWRLVPNNPLPLLLVGALVCGVLLARDPSFAAARLWNGAALVAYAPAIALAMLASLPLLWALTAWLAPSEQFALVRRQPRLWALIMVAYPIVSVYPQELLYRAWFFHRYAALLPSPLLRVAASALAFAWGHVFFPRARVAMLLTLLGGALFSWHYEVTQSLAVASVEHALFGNLLFTLGLGRFFYHRGAATAPTT